MEEGEKEKGKICFRFEFGGSEFSEIEVPLMLVRSSEFFYLFHFYQKIFWGKFRYLDTYKRCDTSFFCVVFSFLRT